MAIISTVASIPQAFVLPFAVIPQLLKKWYPRVFDCVCGVDYVDDLYSRILAWLTDARTAITKVPSVLRYSTHSHDLHRPFLLPMTYLNHTLS